MRLYAFVSLPRFGSVRFRPVPSALYRIDRRFCVSGFVNAGLAGRNYCGGLAFKMSPAVSVLRLYLLNSHLTRIVY